MKQCLSLITGPRHMIVVPLSVEIRAQHLQSYLTNSNIHCPMEGTNLPHGQPLEMLVRRCCIELEPYSETGE